MTSPLSWAPWVFGAFGVFGVFESRCLWVVGKLGLWVFGYVGLWGLWGLWVVGPLVEQLVLGKGNAGKAYLLTISDVYVVVHALDIVKLADFVHIQLEPRSP